MRLICVPPDRAAEAWPRVAHWMRAAMERTDFGSLDYVEKAVLSGTALLWLVWDGKQIVAGVATEIHQSARRRIGVILACGGEDMKRWLHLIEQIHDYARAESCSAMRLVGPKGWERALDGYRTAAVILERTL